MRRFVIVVSAILLLLSVIMKSRTSQELPERAAFSVNSENKIVVKISGDVLHPGIYYLPTNILAGNAIKMAGTSRPLNSTESSFLNPIIKNGTLIILTLLPEGNQSIILENISAAERLIMKIPLDIRTMNEADFDCIPGVGPKLAKRIIEYRQYNGGVLSVEDLKKVEGIGEKKYNMIKSYF